MTLYSRIDPEQALQEGQRELIAYRIASGHGDPADPAYRRVCYAAVADHYTAFLAGAGRSLAPDQVVALRDNLIAAIEDFEARSGGFVVDAAMTTSLRSFAPPLKSAATPDREPTSVPTVQGKSEIGRLGLAAFVGASSVLLMLFAMQQIGVLYLETNPKAAVAMRMFNEGSAVVEPQVKATIAALNETQDRLLSYRDSPEGRANADIAAKFLPIRVVFPDLYEKFNKILPNNANIALRLTPDRAGYKILMPSDFCGAVALRSRALIDPTRDKGALFCRYLALWNAEGRKL